MAELSEALRILLEREHVPLDAQRVIGAVYEPLVQRIAIRSRAAQSPLVVGLCGPQGSGKSTLALILRTLLLARSVSTVILALDDLYMTRAERTELAQRVHPLLRTRGVPGTHDVALGLRILDALNHDGEVVLPSFDKGTDDRRPQSQVPLVTAPVQVVLFEGWCVGAKPQHAGLLIEPVNELERDHDPDGRWRRYVNDSLAREYQKLFDRIDSLVLLKPPLFDAVYAWRSEQEHKLRQHLEFESRDTSRVMRDDEVRRFIAHYERLTKHILEEMPARADVVIELDMTRTPRQVIYANSGPH